MPTVPGRLQRRLGHTTVGAVGLGAMNLASDSEAARAQAFSTLRVAVELGVTLVDTADAYGPSWADFHANERLVAQARQALGAAGAHLLIATKGGHTRTADAWDVDGRPDYLRTACERSLRALGVDCIDLYQLHRPDPRIPYAESIGALRDLKAAGKIAMIGISNATVAHIAEAIEVLGPGELASVQNELSPGVRAGMVELEECAARDVAFLIYSPLGGVGTGHLLGAQHSAFAEIAKERAISPQRLAVGWELALGPHVLPLPGCSRPFTVRDCVAATALTLDADELRRLRDA